MKSAGFSAVLVALLGFTLTVSSVIGPVWMATALSQDHMPRSHEGGSAPRLCTSAICQNSPYLVAHLGTTLPLLPNWTVAQLSRQSSGVLLGSHLRFEPMP